MIASFCVLEEICVHIKKTFWLRRNHSKTKAPRSVSGEFIGSSMYIEQMKTVYHVMKTVSLPTFTVRNICETNKEDDRSKLHILHTTTTSLPTDSRKQRTFRYLQCGTCWWRELSLSNHAVGCSTKCQKNACFKHLNKFSTVKERETLVQRVGGRSLMKTARRAYWYLQIWLRRLVSVFA